MFKHIFLFFVVLFILGCKARKTDTSLSSDSPAASIVINRDTTTWLDAKRNRVIPLAFYTRLNSGKPVDTAAKQRPVVINTGYQGKSTDYSYIAKKLADEGFFVVTIQHDLSADNPIPITGNIQQSRLPFWDTGVESILFVIKKMKQSYPKLDYKHLNLIGHSNGGDMVMLLASRYPEVAYRIISLDNRRVAFPRAAYPKLLSIRSSDQVADAGVIPSEQEQQRFGMKLVKVETEHNDMGGMGNEKQLQEINKYILDFLKGV